MKRLGIFTAGVVALGLQAALACPPAMAQGKSSVVVWPTLTPAGDAPAGAPLHKPSPVDRGLFDRAQELDITLRDAVQDLGFTLDVTDPGPQPGHARDEDLLARGQATPGSGPEEGTWVVSPRVENAGPGTYVVRIVAVPPSGHELRVRVETVSSDSVGVRGLVMLRDLLSPQTAAAAVAEKDREAAEQGSSQGIMKPLRSQGRAVLAVNAALFGAFTAFSMERASSSDDPRVLYPLLAVGTGIGIGGSLLVADEWDLTTGDAWYLTAGGWWGAAAAVLVSTGRDFQPFDARYATGVGGGLLGIGLATFAITRTSMDEGDATIAHSGAALGLLLGGATEFLYRGNAEMTPYTGMGVGTAVGLLGAGVLATQVAVSPSRVLLVDLGVGGGALIGTAATSPLLFQNISNPSESNTRASLSATIGGALLGGALAWWVTRDSPAAKRAPHVNSFFQLRPPSFGVVGVSESRRGSAPAYGLTWGGVF